MVPFLTDTRNITLTHLQAKQSHRQIAWPVCKKGAFAHYSVVNTHPWPIDLFDQHKLKKDKNFLSFPFFFFSEMLLVYQHLLVLILTAVSSV